MPIKQTRKYYERLVSPLSAFIQDKIIITYDTKDWITKEEFYESFIEYCKEKKIIAPTYETVGRLMKKVGKGIKTFHKTIAKQQLYVWTGCQYNLTTEEKQTKERQTIEEIWKEVES